MAHDSHRGAPRPADAAWLWCALAPVAGSRGNATDRMVVGVVHYLTAKTSRGLRADAIAERWKALPWPMPAPRVLPRVLARLVERGVLLVDDEGRYRVAMAPWKAAADAGHRFRFEAGDLAHGLQDTALHLLALLRGRAAGRTGSWADSVGHLAGLLGCLRKATGTALAELRRAGLVSTDGTHKLRSGHRLPVLVTAPQDPQEPRNGAEKRPPLRTPTVPSGPVGIVGRIPRTAGPTASTARPIGCTVGLTIRTPFGRSGPSDHPEGCTPRLQYASGRAAAPAARMIQQPATRPEPEPVTAGTLALVVVSEPVVALPPPPPAPRQHPAWLRAEAEERDAAAALRSWPAWAEHLRLTVGRLHLAPADPALVAEALTAVGVFVLARPLTAAGRIGLRRRRQDLAEALAQQGAEPSLLLEAAVLIGRDLHRRGASPAAVGAELATILQERTEDYRQRSRDLAEQGDMALPMAAGIDALARLVQPQRRLPGEFAYRAGWWRGAVPQQVRDAVDDLRALLATTAAAKQVSESHGQIGAAQVWREHRQQEAHVLQRRLQAEAEATQRRQRGRIIGAAQAGAWQRLQDWLPAGTTTADVATWSGVPVATIEAGLATVQRRASA